MSIGIDQRFQQLSRQSEEDLYRESLSAPVVIGEERRAKALGGLSREKLQKIAFESLFFLGTLVIAVCIGYLLYLLLVDQIQAENKGIFIEESSANGPTLTEMAVQGQFLEDELLFFVFSLCAFVGIYVMRLILWAVQVLLKDAPTA